MCLKWGAVSACLCAVKKEGAGESRSKAHQEVMWGRGQVTNAPREKLAVGEIADLERTVGGCGWK